MPLSQDDKELVKLIAVEICREVVPEIIKVHVDSCPHAKNNNKKWNIAIGVIAGVTLVSGSTSVIAVIKMLL